MRSLWFIPLLGFLVHLAFGAPVDVAVEDGESPPDLSPEEFKEMAGTYFIKFYSPYCGHCKALAPKWNAAYRDVGGPETKGLKWAGVNCVTYSDFCQEQSITGYPTLRVYRNNKRQHDLSTSSPSQEDMRYFAEQYLALGDAAFDSKYEIAPPEPPKETPTKEATKETTEETKESPKESKGESKDDNKDDNRETTRETTKETTEESESNRSDGGPSRSANLGDDFSGSGSSTVTALQLKDFGADKNVGRWFVLFTNRDCEGCGSVLKKWSNNDNFARDYKNILWGTVDCEAETELCSAETVNQFPTFRIYEDGKYAYTYEGSTSSATLREFVGHASVAKDFKDFKFDDLVNTAHSEEKAAGNQEDHGAAPPELPAAPTEEPQYLSGPATKPKYKGSKPKTSEVVQYALDTAGQPIDEDPGKLIFGESPEANHNFRTWSAPNAPPPPFVEPGEASYSHGKVYELTGANFDQRVKNSNEPWLLKFFSPKCPHCRDMAAAYDTVAESLKGRLNVGAVNCEVESKLCREEGIEGWPHIALYRGSVALEPYGGARTVEKLLEYAETAWKAQIYPLEDREHLVREINANMDNQITTYVYLYDKSVQTEDWTSLRAVAAKITDWRGKLYRSDSDDLRGLAGISHRGTAFVSVDVSGEPGSEQLKWYEYPHSNIPKMIRDADEVTAWAYRAKWSSIQYLDPEAQTHFSPYVAVLLTGDESRPSADPALLEHKELSLRFRDFFRERWIQDQDFRRVDRLKQHDRALAANNFALARHYMDQPLDTPISVDLAFAYIPITEWVTQYGKHLDVSKHEKGNVIVVNFYKGIYLDTFNSVPIKPDWSALSDASELLQRYELNAPKTSFKSVKKFSKSLRNIPEPQYRSVHFHSKPMPITGLDLLFGGLKVAMVLVVLYLLYRKFLRGKLRNYAASQRRHNDVESKYD